MLTRHLACDVECIEHGGVRAPSCDMAQVGRGARLHHTIVLRLRVTRASRAAKSPLWAALLPAMQSRRMIMKTLMSALVAMAVLASIAAPASAAESDGHCAAGYSNAWGACFK